MISIILTLLNFQGLCQIQSFIYIYIILRTWIVSESDVLNYILGEMLYQEIIKDESVSKSPKLLLKLTIKVIFYILDKYLFERKIE